MVPWWLIVVAFAVGMLVGAMIMLLQENLSLCEWGRHTPAKPNPYHPSER